MIDLIYNIAVVCMSMLLFFVVEIKFGNKIVEMLLKALFKVMPLLTMVYACIQIFDYLGITN